MRLGLLPGLRGRCRNCAGVMRRVTCGKRGNWTPVAFHFQALERDQKVGRQWYPVTPDSGPL